MAVNEALKETPITEAHNSEGERDRSTIAFPYGDLDDALSIANSVHAVGGSTCDWDQVAAHLNQSANSGGFRQKMLTAKVFGVVTYSQGKVTLTPLGSRLCDSKQERLARSDAFLSVPLYKAVFEKFKGNTLPPASGLESEMVNMGVAKKQKERARQVFQRSGMQAGFFWSGQDRLVMPARGNAESPADYEGKLDGNGKVQENTGGGGNGSGTGSGSGSGGGEEYHPFITGLLRTLPAADSDWPMDARRKWLQAASHIFEVIYKDSESKGSLRIEVQKDSTR